MLNDNVVIEGESINISRSTLTYRALYYGKIETQTSYIYIYIYIVNKIQIITYMEFVNFALFRYL